MFKSTDIAQLLVDFDQQISWPDNAKVTHSALLFFTANFSFDCISISLVNQTNTAFEVISLVDPVPGILTGKDTPLNKLTLQKILSQKKPHYRKALSQRKRLSSFEKSLISRGVQAYLLVPLLIGDTVVGSLNICSNNVAGIAKGVRSTIDLLSRRLALALHHARLHDSLKEQERLIAASEKNYRELIEQAGDAILKGNSKGALKQVNQAAANMFGYSKDDLLNMNITALFSAAVLEEKPLRFDLLHRGQTIISERALLRKDKTSIPVEMNSRNLPDGSFVSIIRDLSKRKETYENLRAAEERYQILFTNSPDPVVVHNGKIVLDANLAAVKFFNAKTPEKYIGRLVSDFIHPDSLSKARTRIKELLASRQANQPTHQQYLTAGGIVRDVEATAAVINYEGQTAIITSFRDITDQKRDQDLLLASEENFRLLFEANPNPIIVHHDGLIAYINQAALDFVGGKTRSEFIGKDVFSFVHEDSREASRKNGLMIQNEGLSTVAGEQKYLRADGEVRHVESRGVPILYMDKPSVMVSFIDTTDRIEARQALRESRQQLELVTDHVTHFIVLMDLELNLLYVNLACVNWFEVSKDNLYHKNLADLIVSGAMTSARRSMTSVLQGLRSSFPYTYESQTGKVYEFLATLIPVFDQSQNIVAVLGQVEDITEEETSRRELAENKALLELIIDTIPGLFAYSDTDENYLYVNQAYADWNSLQKEAVVGRSIKQVLPPETYHFIKPYLTKIKLGEPQAYSRDITTQTDQNRSFDIRYIPHLDHQQKVIGFLTSLQDVTEKKLVESYQLAQRNLAYRLTNTLDLNRVGKISAETIWSVFKHDAFTIELYNYTDGLVLGIYSEDTFINKLKPREVKSYIIPFSKISPDWFSPDFQAFCTNRTPVEIKKGIETIPFGENRLSQSLLFVPIRWEDKNIGLVSVQSYAQNTYSETDLPLLQSFADQIGGALIRAQRETQLEEQHKTLVREEKKYRSLIENAGDAVFVATLSGNIHMVNEPFCSVLGYSKEELLSMNIRDIDPQFFKNLNRQKIASLKADEGSYTLESTYKTKANSSYSVEQRISLGEINHKPNIICFARDITERKLAELREQSLRKLAHDLNASTSMQTVGQLAARAIRSFFDSDAFAIEFFDTKNQIIVGVYSEDTFRTEKIPREISASDADFSKVRSDFFKLNTAAHVRNRSAKQLKVLQNSRPFGSGRLSHSLLFAPIVWENNNIGVLSVQSYTDHKYSNDDLGDIQTFADQIGGALVRARKDEELTAKKNELQESEEKYRSIIENAGDALFVATFQGKVLAFNQHATESLGYNEEQLFDKNLKEFNPGFRKQLPLRKLKKLAEDQSSITIETTHIREDGSFFPVELRVGTMEMAGKQAVLYFARDISERVANETFREALRKMARALTISLLPREIGQIAAAVLYDLFSQDAFVLYKIDCENQLVYNLYAEDTFVGDAHPREIEIDTSAFDLKNHETVMSIARPLLINSKTMGKMLRLDAFGDVARKSKSLVFVPLFWEGVQIGLFTLQSYTSNKFTDDDVEKLKIFANQVGGALVRAQTDAELLTQTDELKTREHDLEAMVNEKDTLLKEVYHRTKNNMQVIVGLLEMHGYKTKHTATLTVIREMVDRISSMSMVHDLLYRSKSLAVIQLDVYLEKLITRLLSAYQTSVEEVGLNFKSDPIPVDIQFAVPLGLVVNEVVSNALKHAFPLNRDGQITVVIKSWKNSGLDLKISDNGIGLKKGFNPLRSTSLGMLIIQDIIKLQLFGEITTISDGGLTYQIRIPNLVLD